MLLARPRPYPDECLVSYLIRVSELNGFRHIGYLLHYAGLNWKNKRVPIYQILSGDFDIAPLLLALQLPSHHSKIIPLYKSFQRVIDTPYFIVKHPKICPDCLRELGYCKFEWSLLPVLACVNHKKMLVDVSSVTGKRLGWYRQHLTRFEGELSGIKSSYGFAPPNIIQMSLFVESLLSGGRCGCAVPAIVKGMSLREAISMIHFVAHYQIRLMGGSFNPVAMTNIELGQCYQNAWVLLQDWPDSFYTLLSQYIDRPMSVKGIGGLNKHYRDLYERLYRQQENIGIAKVKAEFDRYIESYWPGVLEVERITRINLTLPARNIISKKETAKILGSRPERVDKLVQQKKLTPVVFKGKAHYLRDQVKTFASEKASNWTMSEACEALQLTRYQLKQLLDAKVISALQKPDGLNRDWIINKTQCQTLVESLINGARNTSLPSGTVSMAGIQRIGYSIVQLVLAMQSGELEYGISPDDVYPISIKQFKSFKRVIKNMN